MHWRSPSSEPTRGLETLTHMMVAGGAFAVLATVILQVARVLLWVCHTEPSRLPGWDTLGPAMLRGGCEDVATSVTLVLSLLVVFSPTLLLSPRCRRTVMRVFVAALSVMAVAVALLSAIEFYYFEFYHNRFDSLMFGLAEYGSGDVLGSIWATYPVGRALLANVVGLLLANVLLWRGYVATMTRLRRPWILAWGGGLGVLTSMGLALVVFNQAHWVQRVIPLTTHDRLGMTLEWNAPQSLVRAMSLYRNELYLNPDPLTDIRKFGFSTVQEATQATGLPSGPLPSIAHRMFPDAPGVPIARHPNVVLGLLESFGADLMTTDGPGNDMMGRLRSHMTTEDVFTHFYAGQGATHPEIENLLLGSPISPLTLNPQHNIPLPTSAAWPFHLAGYRTIFIYSGRRTRENLDQVLRRQGFDEVYAKSDLERRFPEAAHTSWGVYDAYLFRFVQEVIDRESTPEHPVFIFFLTTTNHPPYVLDTPHRDLPVNPKAMGERGNRNMELREHIMRTYQYQADQLGGFLDGLEAGAHGSDTIVAVAGDHNIHEHFQYRFPEEIPDTDRVFAMMHVPTAYRPAFPVDHARWTSHNDLIPTLVHLALPGRPYFATGHSLFAPLKGPNLAVSRFNDVYGPLGLFDGLCPAGARFYPWTKVGRRLAGTSVPLPPNQAAALRWKAGRIALRSWLIRSYLLDRSSLGWDWRWLGFPTSEGPGPRASTRKVSQPTRGLRGRGVATGSTS